MWYEFKDERGRIESGTEIETVVLNDRLQYITKMGDRKKTICPGGVVVDSSSTNCLI